MTHAPLSPTDSVGRTSRQRGRKKTRGPGTLNGGPDNPRSEIEKLYKAEKPIAALVILSTPR